MNQHSVSSILQFMLQIIHYKLGLPLCGFVLRIVKPYMYIVHLNDIKSHVQSVVSI